MMERETNGMDSRNACLTIYGLLRTQSSPKASTLICVLDITAPESETRSVFHFRSFSSSPRSRESVSDFPGRIHGSIPPPFALSSRKKGREKSDHLNLSFRLLPAQISTFVTSSTRLSTTTRLESVVNFSPIYKFVINSRRLLEKRLWKNTWDEQTRDKKKERKKGKKEKTLNRVQGTRVYRNSIYARRNSSVVCRSNG